MTQAVGRKHHYIYRITRIDGSGRYYIGMHSTDNLDDGYFGSGLLLFKSIKKHGKDKHFKEILEHLPTREALKLREKEIVNGELLGDVLCMNLKLGGEGGGKFKDEEHQRKCSEAGAEKIQQMIAANPIYRFERAKHLKPFYGWKNTPRFAGKTHTDETKNKMSASQCGKQIAEKNSQYGTCWVTNGIKPIKIKKEQLEEYLSNGYSQGRK